MVDIETNTFVRRVATLNAAFKVCVHRGGGRGQVAGGYHRFVVCRAMLECNARWRVCEHQEKRKYFGNADAVALVAGKLPDEDITFLSGSVHVRLAPPPTTKEAHRVGLFRAVSLTPLCMCVHVVDIGGCLSWSVALVWL